MAWYVSKIALKKKCGFNILSLLCFYFLHFFFKVTFWTTIAFLPLIWDHIFNTVFPKLVFLFSIQSLKISKNMRKLRVKLRNATIYPPWGLISRSSFFQKRTSPCIWNGRLAPKVTFEPNWWEESGIFLIRGLKSYNLA